MAKLTMGDALAMEEEERKRKQRRQAPRPRSWHLEDIQEEEDLLPFSSEAEFLGYQPGDQ